MIKNVSLTAKCNESVQGFRLSISRAIDTVAATSKTGSEGGLALLIGFADLTLIGSQSEISGFGQSSDWGSVGHDLLSQTLDGFGAHRLNIGHQRLQSFRNCFSMLISHGD